MMMRRGAVLDTRQSGCGRSKPISSTYRRRHALQVAASDGGQRAAQQHAAAAAVPVRFVACRKVRYGEQLAVVGGDARLGAWDAARGLRLKWHDGHVWAGEAELAAGARVEFKLVVLPPTGSGGGDDNGGGGGSAEWEPGPNREFKVLGGGHSLDVRCVWGQTGARDVRGRELAPGAEPFGPLPSAADLQQPHQKQQQKPEQQQPEQQQETGSSNGIKPTAAAAVAMDGNAAASSSPPSSSSSSSSSWLSDEEAAAPQWQGRAVRFMRSNDHTRERAGRWDAEGLPPGPVRELVEGDRGAPNWLGKLAVAQRLLVDSAPRMRPELDALAAGYAYLSWTASGALPCVEGGGHHRPNHHARAAQQIFRSLEWAIEDDGRAAAGRGATAPRLRALLARRLHARLPSFNESFTASVPLTRIRDIAHRNDIPQELKQEIKHTLQNKLHRNAGPEDLVATQAMLARVTATPGEYSAAFVDEFRVFAAELRDFFNAGSLTATLEALRPVVAADPADGQVLDGFLAAKAQLDARGGSGGGGDGAAAAADAAAPLAELMGVAHALTTLRALLLRGLASGLRNDAPDAALAMRQRFRVAELRCEDYLFVLMSRFANSLDAEGGADALAKARSSIAWSHPLAMLLLAVRNIGLGGWLPAECMAIENELTAWQQEASYDEPANALRLKATLERVLRLAGGYTDALVDALTAPAQALGGALGVDGWVVRTFAEGEVRASVVFQLSKLAAVLLAAARRLAGVAPWEPLVAGACVGTLVEAPRLDPAALAGLAGPTVLLLRAADGDEEVAAAGRALQGVVLTQGLPHLSHLGVRARQERVPFVTIEDAAVVERDVLPLVGQVVALTATPAGVELRRATAAEEAAAAAAAAPGTGAVTSSSGNGAAAAASTTKPGIVKATKPGIVPLAKCTTDVGGAKAAACAQLEQLAAAAAAAGGAGKAFRVPRSVVVPFGAMELAIAAAPAPAAARYRELLAAAERAPIEDLDPVCDDLQALIRSVPVPDAIVDGIATAFSSSNPSTAAAASAPSSPPLLVVRSSANVEDLSGMSGAGLYESVPNVPAGVRGDIAAAVAEVWASLHTRRAVLSRRAAGVAQDYACMAVLVQEMLSPMLSFVLHTASPLGDAPGTAVAEVAVGLGETLASGTRGSAWRLAVDKATGQVDTLAFANFSTALLPSSSVGVGGSGGGGGSNGTGALHKCAERVLDYSQQPLSRSVEARKQLGAVIAQAATLLEREFGGPQDVEGCFVGEDGVLYIVQSRPQPL